MIYLSSIRETIVLKPHLERRKIMNKEAIKSEVLDASKKWVQAFNERNVKVCSETYLADAVMDARPIGKFEGREAIETFWSDFVSSENAADLVYANVNVVVIGETSAKLSALWSMNVGRGFITQELWVKENCEWFLAYDDFTVEEKFS